MTTEPHAIVDRQGRVIFRCWSCHEAFTSNDFFEVGLRLPDDGETADDYFSAELLDELTHARCAKSQRAG